MVWNREGKREREENKSEVFELWYNKNYQPSNEPQQHQQQQKIEHSNWWKKQTFFFIISHTFQQEQEDDLNRSVVTFTFTFSFPLPLPFFLYPRLFWNICDEKCLIWIQAQCSIIFSFVGGAYLKLSSRSWWWLNFARRRLSRWEKIDYFVSFAQASKQEREELNMTATTTKITNAKAWPEVWTCLTTFWNYHKEWST